MRNSVCDRHDEAKKRQFFTYCDQHLHETDYPKTKCWAELNSVRQLLIGWMQIWMKLVFEY